jgi:hypothetical protein
MLQHKALLIGASDYDDPAIQSLPFVWSDLRRLQQSLLTRGFQSATVAESKRGTTPNFVDKQVSEFLWRGNRGETLLVVLSGHGLHHSGADYLIPEDAHLSVSSIEKSCIKIDWSRELENSSASQVIFFVDACREGVESDAMMPPAIKQWSSRKIEASLRRKVAYVYACSRGQYSLFVRESDRWRGEGDSPSGQGDSFSLFSRAVSDVISRPGVADLGSLESHVQLRIDQLHKGYGKTRFPQRVHVVTDIGKSDFLPLPHTQKKAPQRPPFGKLVKGSSNSIRGASVKVRTPGGQMSIDPVVNLRAPAHRTERELLKVALQHPELVYPAFDAFGEDEFTFSGYAEIRSCIQRAGVRGDESDYLERVRASATDPLILDLVSELAAEEIHSRRVDAEYAGMQLSSVRVRSVQRRMNDLQAKLSALSNQPEPTKLKSVQQELWTLQQYHEQLRRRGFEAL